MAEQSLKNKTVRGTFWSAADAFLGQGVSFIVGLILARLLSPDEYGLIGIVLIFTSVMMGVVDSGFSNALIRKDRVNKEDYSTLFFLNLLMSGLMYIILYVSAPWIAVFFERPQLVVLIRATGVLLFFQALAIVQYTKLSREIDFKTKTKASVISALISGVLGVIMAYEGFGVWSLVAQQLSRELLYAGCLWFYNRWAPELRFSIISFKYMWGFGWKILLSGLLNNVWKELYQIIVGKFYSPATLGQYTRAKQYATIFSSNLTIIVQRVSYPVLSQVRGDRERMLSAYRRIIKTTMFVTAILLISMAAVAEPLIFCLIGPQWHQAALFLPFICVSLSLYPLQAINLNMLEVEGRTDIFLYVEIIKKVIALGPLFLGAFVGIYWMLVGSIITGIIAFFLNSFYTGKSLGYTSWMQLKDVSPSYGIALIVAVSVYFFKYLPISYWVVLPIQVIVGAIVFFFVCESLKLPEYIEVKEIAIEFCEKILLRKQR